LLRYYTSSCCFGWEWEAQWLAAPYLPTTTNWGIIPLFVCIFFPELNTSYRPRNYSPLLSLVYSLELFFTLFLKGEIKGKVH
jgi:hypothetical protein